mgnify:CR=1 FL=1
MKLFTNPFMIQQKKWQKNKCHAMGLSPMVGICPLLLFILNFFLISCSVTNKTLIIWTDIPEFASYAELFNYEHKDFKTVVVYKSEIGRNLPPLKDEIQPDLIVSSYLKNSSCRKYFTPLDYLFQDKLKKSDFYKCLLEYGKINDKQYLLPVSFNIPALICDRKNEHLIEGTRTISLEEIRKLSKDYNSVEKKGSFSRMGYAPSWDADFLYLLSQLYGSSYAEKHNSFSWQEEGLEKGLNFSRSWTQENNSSTEAEQNFAFKYLYMPKYRQVESSRCLFAFYVFAKLF